MPTDEERREVARRLRKCTPPTSYRQSQGGGWAHLCDMALAVGFKREDNPTAWEFAQRLADLIEPSEPEVKYVAEVKVDGWRLEQLAHDAAVELTGIDRDALLELADKARKLGDEENGPASFAVRCTFRVFARNIYKALGVCRED